MQIGIGRREARDFKRGVGQALRPLDMVPVDFEICAEAQAMRRSGTEDAGEVDEAYFIAACGEAEVGPHDEPVALGVFDLEA